MPTSHYSTISPLLEIILDLNKQHELRKVLDIGVGFGKWGALLDEYLRKFKRDPINGEKQLGSRVLLFGCEPNYEYKTLLWKSYNVFYPLKALQTLPILVANFDLILLFDVLEHHTREEGHDLLRLCLEKSKYTLVSTPKRSLVGQQKHLYGNPLEMHKSQWHEQDFLHIAKKSIFEHPTSLIILLWH